MLKTTVFEAKRRNTLWASAIICALLSGCGGKPNTIQKLPELPTEFARNLIPARTAPVLMTKSAPAPPPIKRRPTGVLPLTPARSCTALYDGYVVYPIAVCYPPGELNETLILTAARVAPPTGKPMIPPTRYFKLTSHPLVRSGFPWFCTVRGGPWYAHVEGAQICNTNPNVRSFKADILGAPQPVVVYWTGALEDVPPPLNLLGIQQTGEQCVCCSGSMCPSGNCVPNPNQCHTGPPA
jgi:hypothetical protein